MDSTEPSVAEQGVNWERATEIARRCDVTSIAVFKPEDVLLLCGLWPQSNMSILIVLPEERQAHLIAAENAFEGQSLPEELSVTEYNYVSLWKPDASTVIGDVLEQLLHDVKTVGVPFADPYASVPPLLAEAVEADSKLLRILESRLPSLDIVDISERLAKVRAVKTDAEITAIQRAVEIAEMGVAHLSALESEFTPITEAELALRIRHTIEREAVNRGLLGRAWAQISSGPRTGSAAYLDFVEPTRREIEETDLVLLELVTVLEGFWADLTCLVQAGGWTVAEDRDRYEAVRHAQERAVQSLRPGATGTDIDAAARDTLREHGFEKEFLHVTGHGVGFRYHENFPMLAPESDDQIDAGNVVTIEPGIYGTGFGVRLEADIAVTEDGPQWLSQRPAILS